MQLKLKIILKKQKLMTTLHASIRACSSVQSGDNSLQKGCAPNHDNISKVSFTTKPNPILTLLTLITILVLILIQPLGFSQLLFKQVTILRHSQRISFFFCFWLEL